MLARLRNATRASSDNELPKGRPPLFLQFRSSTGFITFVVAVGVVVDLSGYALIVPVVPYRLQELGYSNVSSKTGWLVAAYSGGLIASTPVVAWAGQHFDRRQPPLILALVFMAAALFLFMFTDNYAAMIVSRIWQGCSGTGLWTLGLAPVSWGSVDLFTLGHRAHLPKNGTLALAAFCLSWSNAPARNVSAHTRAVLRPRRM